MNTINIAGIPFSPESLEALREWITPEYCENETAIGVDIASVEKTQSFLLYHWDEFGPESDARIKSLLTGLQYIKERLVIISQISKNGKSNCDQTSQDSI